MLTDQTTKARTIIGALTFGIDYKESQREEMPLILNALDMAWETGDSEDMALCAVKLAVTTWWAGSSIRQMREEYNPRVVQTMRAIQRPMQQRWVAPYLQVSDCLAGEAEDPGSLVGEWIDFEAEMERPKDERFMGDANATVIAAAMDMLLAYMWKDYRRAMRDLAVLKTAQRAAKAYKSSEEIPFTWLEVMVRIKNLWFAREEKRPSAPAAANAKATQGADGSVTESMGPARAIPEDDLPMAGSDEFVPLKWSILSEFRELQKIKALLKTLKQFADMAPMNHRHRYLVASAELAAYKKNVSALELYEEAASEAKNRSFQWEYGLIRELQVEFLLSLRNATSAKQVMREAVHYYAKDGALAKARHLEILYPQLISTKTDFSARTLSRLGSDGTEGMQFTNSVVGESVDVLTLFKTTQAISMQLSLEKLLETLAGIVLENSGAQKVSFVTIRRNSPRIVGEAWIDQATQDDRSRQGRLSYTGSETSGKGTIKRRAGRPGSVPMLNSTISDRPRNSSQPDLRITTGTADRRPSESAPTLSIMAASDVPAEQFEGRTNRSGSFKSDGIEEIQMQTYPPEKLRRSSSKSADVIASAIAAANGILITPATKPGQASSRRPSAVEFATQGLTMLRKSSLASPDKVPGMSRRQSVTIVQPEEPPRKQSYQSTVTATTVDRNGSISGPSNGSPPGPPVAEDEEDRRPSDTSAGQTPANPNVRFVSTDKPVDYESLPLTVINYVIRTKESVVLDNAIADPRFSHDAYIVKNKPLSILACPIGLQKNNMLGIAYLESRALTGVFTAERLYVLNIVFGQAGISLENARLYSAINKFVPNDMISQLSHESVVNVQLGDCIDTEMSVMFTE